MIWLKLTPADPPLPETSRWVNMGQVVYLYRNIHATVLRFSADLTMEVAETPEQIDQMIRAERLRC